MKEIKICKGLTLQKKEAGHWLLFKCNSGNEVSVCLEGTHGDLGKKVTLEWAKDMLKEPKQTNKYITKDIDWTGCNEEIKEFLLNNPRKMIQCICDCGIKDYIKAYDHANAQRIEDEVKYIGENSNHITATPIIRKQRFLPLSGLIKVLEDNGFEGKGKSMVDELGNHYPISSLIKIEKTIYNDPKDYNFPILPEFLTSEES